MCVTATAHNNSATTDHSVGTMTLTTVMIIMRIICDYRTVLLTRTGDELRSALVVNGVAVDNLTSTCV